MKPENSILVLISVSKYIEELLNDDGWQDRYELIVAGNLADSEKKISETVGSDTQLKLPIISLTYGPLGVDPREMGSAYGDTTALLRIFIYGVNLTQSLTLAEFLKRELSDCDIDIKDYTSHAETALGTITTKDARVDPILKIGDPNLALRYEYVLETEITFPAEKLLT